MAATTETRIPNNVTEWIESLPNRPGWGGWQNAGTYLHDGVQNWSEAGDENTAIGVWGNVVENDEREYVDIEWAIYVGTCRDPHESGLPDAETAMRRAEIQFPWMFAELLGSLIPCEPDEVSATDMAEAIADTPEGRWETYRMHREGVAETGWLIFSRQERRVAVALGADSDWTDAESVEEVLYRYERGKMLN